MKAVLADAERRGWLLVARDPEFAVQNRWWQRCRDRDTPYCVVTLNKKSARLLFDTFCSSKDFHEPEITLIKMMMLSFMEQHRSRSYWGWGPSGCNLSLSGATMSEREAGDIYTKMMALWVTKGVDIMSKVTLL